jgi:hypothetical protein
MSVIVPSASTLEIGFPARRWPGSRRQRLEWQFYHTSTGRIGIVATTVTTAIEVHPLDGRMRRGAGPMHVPELGRAGP